MPRSTDPIDTLFGADPDALAWILLLAYTCGHDAAIRQTRIAIEDARAAQLIDATATAWRLRQRPARQLNPPGPPEGGEGWGGLPGVEPWPEEVT